jgi:predicted SprT family Zn-dependent metalloprotease
MLNLTEQRSFQHEYNCTCGHNVTIFTDMKVRDNYKCRKCQSIMDRVLN